MSEIHMHTKFEIMNVNELNPVLYLYKLIIMLLNILGEKENRILKEKTVCVGKNFILYKNLYTIINP
jgi:hypothetical protein